MLIFGFIFFLCEGYSLCSIIIYEILRISYYFTSVCPSTLKNHLLPRSLRDATDVQFERLITGGPVVQCALPCFVRKKRAKRPFSEAALCRLPPSGKVHTTVLLVHNYVVEVLVVVTHNHAKQFHFKKTTPTRKSLWTGPSPYSHTPSTTATSIHHRQQIIQS